MIGYISRQKYTVIRLLTILFALQLLVFPLIGYAEDIPSSSCNSYLLADADSGYILIANKPDEIIYPASITKIMTALLLLDNIDDLSQTVTVGDELDSFASDASVMGLEKGEIISYEDLLYGLMLPSGADAAVAIAVNIGGSIEEFADMMNERAEELGMSNTHFVNPHGLHDEDHYSTSSDILFMTIAAMQYPVFVTVVSTSSHTTQATNKHPDGIDLCNTNKLVSTRSANEDFYYEYAVGVKTGYTDAAKGCLVAAAQKDGQTYITVMLGDDSTVGDQRRVKRFTDSVDFFEYGFTQQSIDVYDMVRSTDLSAILPGETEETSLTAIVKTTSIIHWMDKSIAAELQSEEAVLDISYDFIEPSLESPPPTESSITVVGTVTFSFQGIELYACDVVRTPVETETDDQATALIRLVSMILISMGVLFLIILIINRVSRTRSVQNRKYQSSRRGNKRSRTRLRDPHDYR